MQKPIPTLDLTPLSPQLRDLIHRLRGDSPALSVRMLETLRSTIPDYGALDDKLAQDVYHAGVKNAELWYDSLLARDTPDDEGLRWIGRFSQRRHEQDVSLGALLQAYRTGARVYFDTLLAEAGQYRSLNDEVLFGVSPFMLHYSDVISRTVSEAYYADRGAARPLCDTLADALFESGDSVSAFEETVHALGLDPALPHVAIALRLSSPKAEPDLMAVLMPEESTPPLPQRGHSLLWLPAPAAEPAEEREARLAALVRRLTAHENRIVAAGVGLPGCGTAGWRTSAEQAITAIAVGGRISAGETVHRYAEFALDAMMLHSDELSGLYMKTLERLAGEPVLLSTLEVYFAQRQNHKAVAAELGIQRNTLMLRLRRIESLLKVRFDDMGSMVRLYLALRQHRLTDPIQPPLH